MFAGELVEESNNVILYEVYKYEDKNVTDQPFIQRKLLLQEFFKTDTYTKIDKYSFELQQMFTISNKT